MLHDVAHTVAPFMWGGIALAMITLRHRRKMARIATNTLPEDGPNSEVAQLRERVRVLERIATDAERRDSSQALAARIEALRD